MGKSDKSIWQLALIVNLGDRTECRITKFEFESIFDLENVNFLPLWVEYASVWEKPHKLIWSGDGVQVRFSSIENVRIWLPNFAQHFNAEGQVFSAGKGQPPVHPRLAEIAIHGVGLKNEQSILSKGKALMNWSNVTPQKRSFPFSKWFLGEEEEED